MKRRYVDWTPTGDKIELVRVCDEIATQWNADGYEMTLRQLYYQLVSRNVVPNTERSYKNVGNLVAKARDAGLIDWEHIVDRTRACVENSHWASPRSILRSCAWSYAIDTRADQPIYIEVWVEKEALAGIVGGVCERLDVPRFSCRGYSSATAMHDAGRRFAAESSTRSRLVILHLGDHDPSGLDMTKDIRNRVNLYSNDAGVEVKRIALNMDQVRTLGLPPNPAKLSDARAAAYVAEYGRESWELDALSPQYIEQLIEEAVTDLTDESALRARQEKQRTEKKSIELLSDNYDVALGAVVEATSVTVDDDDEEYDDDEL